MSSDLRFDGRVALVTGAGAGLGRQYALFFGNRGAKVVVNDLGGDIHGSSNGSSRPADLVVDEIRRAGGTAVSNYNSVEDGDKLVQTALDNFGRIDIVVNNAGILRDKSIMNMTVQDWDIIQRVHLRGSFLVSKAAWPHMKKQNFGRIILTSSAAGIYGNYGQANYGSAKLGLLGLGNTLAIEGRKNNIHCNTIAPIAGSRLTETVMPADLVAQLKPDYVAPLVLYLCHDSCEENGSVFEVGAGWIGKLRWERTKGSIVHRQNVELLPEQVRDNWEKIVDFTNSEHITSIQESSGHFVSALQGGNPEVGQSSGGTSCTFDYDSREVILYALSVGLSANDKDFLKFLYEGSEDFSVLPTFGVIPSFAAFFGSGEGPSLSEQTGIKNIDPTRLFHGEQYIEIKRPFPVKGSLVSSAKVVDVLDKGSGAVIITETETSDKETGELICLNQFVVFCAGAGNFGGKRRSDVQKMVVDPPTRPADFVVKDVTSVDQAALYRLNGDRNPLHIDPAFAAMGGQSTPILHGLCTLGYAGRQVLKTFANNDVSKFKSMKVRFSKPVIPGQTVKTEMWKEGARIHVRCTVVETGEVCLSGGYVDLNNGGSSGGDATGFDSAAAVFDAIGQRVANQPELGRNVGSVLFQWTVDTTSGVKQWVFDFKSNPPRVYQGQSKSDCELILSEQTLLDMITGKVNAQKAFMQGQLKLKGNIMLSQKLEHVLKDASKL